MNRSVPVNNSGTMKKFNAVLFLLILIFTFMVGVAGADDDLWKKYASKYPSSQYYVGIGEIQLKGSEYAAYRVAQVHALKDIAQQVKVRVDSSSVDYACSGSVGKSMSAAECKNEFISIIKVSTDEYLSGSYVAEKGKDSEYVYVVMVMPKKGMADSVRGQMKDSLDKSNAMVDKAKAGDASQADSARKEMLKAKAYKKHLESIEGVKDSSDEAFIELDSELDKL